MSAIRTESVSLLEWVGIVCAVVSGVIHLVIGVPGVPSPLAVSFVLAGVAFFVAVGLLLYDVRKRLVYAGGIPFVGVQIVLWYRLNGFPLDETEIVDKLAQVVLLGICVYLLVEDDETPTL